MQCGNKCCTTYFDDNILTFVLPRKPAHYKPGADYTIAQFMNVYAIMVKAPLMLVQKATTYLIKVANMQDYVTSVLQTLATYSASCYLQIV